MALGDADVPYGDYHVPHVVAWAMLGPPARHRRAARRAGGAKFAPHRDGSSG